jgi:predicted Zn-dependent protease
VHGAATAAMQLEPWDFMAVYFDAIDHFSHGFMKYHPPQLPWVNDDEYEMYNDVVNSAYRFHDLMLGVYMELAGDDTTIMIVSDHGFHPDHLRPKDLPNEPAGPAEEHRHFGMIAAMGPGIRKDELLFGATLLDITPTILALMGKPLGRDMDGRPLLNAFNEKVEVEYIDSWDDVLGDAGTHPEGMAIDPVDQHEALKQLADLGYIDEPNEDQAIAVANTVAELRYNLARDLLDSGKLNESLTELQSLWQEFEDQSRFGVKIFDIQLMLNRPKEARATFEKICQRKEVYANAAAEELKLLETGVLKDKKPEELSQAEHKSLRKLRQRMSTNAFTMIFLEARLLSAENKLEEALAAYKQILKVQEHNRPHLYQCISELLQRQKKWLQAQQWFNKILKIDSINAVAHFGLANCYLAQRKNKLALHEAKAAIGLQFQNPKAHYILGVSLQRLNQPEAAIKAIQVAVSQNPLMVIAHKRLQHIYAHRLNNPLKSAEHQLLAIAANKTLRENKRQKNTPHLATQNPNFEAKIASLAELSQLTKGSELADDEIVVVSGLPRSGTSMMMQMLQAGGIKAYVDNERQADEDNPKGYFEHQKVKALNKDASWLDGASGQSIKVITQLLPSIPANKKLKIIYMERDLREILASQTKMLNRRDKKGSGQTQDKLANTYVKQVERVKVMLERRSDNIQLKSINYTDVITNPEKMIAVVSEFFGGKLDTQAMLNTIDTKLYRQKIVITDALGKDK